MPINSDVLCIGSFFTRNYGDRAIFRVVKQALYSQAGLRARPFPLKPIFANRRGSSMGLAKKFLIGPLLLPLHYVRMFRRAQSAKAVLIGGGNLIHDVYPLTVIQFLFACLTIKAAGRKFWIFAVGAGPLRSWLSRACVSIACRLSRGVIVRDSYSLSVLKQCRGLETHLRSEVVPDVVLTIDRKEKRPIVNSKLRIGVSTMFYMMPGSYPGGTIEAYEAYLGRMESLIRLIVSQTGAKVIIFSTEPSEDQEAVNDLTTRVRDLEEVRGIRISSLSSAISLTGSCDFHVGSRLHSLILSLAQGVPSIALTSHGRISGLYNDLEASDLLYDIAKFEPTSVVDTLRHLGGERGKLLLANVDKLKRESMKGISNMVTEVGSFVHR